MKKLLIILLFIGAVTNTGVTIYYDDFKGKCPICVKEGKKSTVYVGGCRSTLIGTYSYYDEDGNYHYNDPNTTTCSYKCTNGHKFSSRR